jgi:cytochrome c553
MHAAWGERAVAARARVRWSGLFVFAPFSKASLAVFTLQSEMSRKVEAMCCSLKIRRLASCLVVLGLALSGAHAQTTTPSTELQRWQQAAGQPGDAAKGQAFFKQRHGGEWSCASCHGLPPNRDSQHASTGKKISPLAPAFHAERFTDTAKVDKWFKRNCKDVLSRECTAIEKADVIAYLIGLK